MSNPQSNSVYTIRSVIDGSALNVSHSSLDDGAPIITYPPSGTANEKWRVCRDGNKIRLESQIDGDSGKMVDEDGSRNIANLWEKHGGANQDWVLEPVAFVLKNSQTGRALKSAGIGEQVVTVQDAAKEGKNTWWIFNKA